MSTIQLKRKRGNRLGFVELKPDMFVAKVDNFIVVCFYKGNGYGRYIHCYFKMKNAIDKPFIKAYQLLLFNEGIPYNQRHPFKRELLYNMNRYTKSELWNFHKLAKSYGLE